MAPSFWREIKSILKEEVSVSALADPSRLVRLTLLAREVGRSVRDDRAFTLATALAFKTLVGLVPLMAISLAFVAMLDAGGGTATYTDHFIQVIRSQLPEFGGKEQLISIIRDFASQAKAIAGIGFLVLLGVAYSMLSSIEQAFNLIWQVTERRPFLNKAGAFFATILIVPILMSVSVFLGSNLAAFAERGAEYLSAVQARIGGGVEPGRDVRESGSPKSPERKAETAESPARSAADATSPAAGGTEAISPVAPGEGEAAVEALPRRSLVARLVFFLSSLLTTVMAMTALFSFMPHTPVRRKPALTGALFTALVFEFAKYGFQVYASWVGANYTKIYGPLSAFPVFLLWLYLVWVIILVGAEIAFVTQNFRDLAARAELERRGITTRVYLAVRTVEACAARFRAGVAEEGMVDAVAERLQAPPYAVRQIVAQLLERQILRRVIPGKEIYLPAKDIHALSIYDVARAVLNDTLEAPETPDDSLRRRIDALFRSARASLGRTLGSTSFADLVREEESAVALSDENAAWEPVTDAGVAAGEEEDDTPGVKSDEGSLA